MARYSRLNETTFLKKGNFQRNVFLLSICSLFSFLPLAGQTKLILISSESKPIPSFQSSHADTATARAYLSSWISNIHMETSLLEASIDSFYFSGDTLFGFFHEGPSYDWVRLKNGNIPASFLQKTGFRESFFRNKPIQLANFYKMQSRLLESAENNGYPFARVYLDSIEIGPGYVEASILMDKNQLILFDPLELEGSLVLSAGFLARYLHINAGEPFNRQRILNIPMLLKELPFAEVKADPLIQFRGDRAVVGLVLDKKRASRFDFILGVLPQNEELGRLLVTGTFNGEMQNQFGLGERIMASYDQLRPETRELNLAFNYPYILQSPFGADLYFHLYKRDTTYLDVRYDVGAQYLLGGGSYLKIFWDQTSSRLLAFNKEMVVAQRQLPPQLDVRRLGFGLEYLWQRLDYRFNPRKGISWKVKGSFGQKNISRSNLVSEISDPENPGFDFGTLYDSLTLRSYQHRLEYTASVYFPFFSNQTLKMGITGASIISGQPVFLNEQYRLGGNALLRGFDEEAIFATNFAVGTLEYRLLTGQNSFLFSFLDAAWIDSRTNRGGGSDFPLGFGAGLTFETNAGVFGVSYALGTQRSNPIDWRSGKIHFGYVSMF